MRFDLLVRAFGVGFFVALCFGCKSPANSKASASATTTSAASIGKPPPLALESFEAAWELIRDTHFDTNFNGLDWDAVRATFRPRIEQARSQEEVRETIQAMLDLLNVS